MKFEAAHAEVLDEAASLACSHLPPGRVDTGEGNEHIRVGSRPFGYFLVGDSYQAGRRLHVYREDDAGHLPLPIVSRYLRDGRPWSFILEVICRGLLHRLPHRIIRNALRYLRMGMHVNRHQVLYVHVYIAPFTPSVIGLSMWAHAFRQKRARQSEQETDESTSGGNNPPRYLWQAKF